MREANPRVFQVSGSGGTSGAGTCIRAPMMYRQALVMDFVTSTKASGGLQCTDAKEPTWQISSFSCCVLRDERLLRQDDFLGCDKVHWEKLPMNIAPIYKVRIIRISCRQAQGLLYQLSRSSFPMAGSGVSGTWVPHRETLQAAP